MSTTKLCSNCEEEQPSTEFYRNKATRSGLTSWCKSCFREAQRQNNAVLKEARRKEKALKPPWKERQRWVKQKFVWRLLNKFNCYRCGMNDPLVLEFHHINAKDKKQNISTLVCASYSMERLKEELRKCKIICANCHRKVTAKENNSWKFRYLNISANGKHHHDQ
jgi:transcription elongation factor Elf1